MSKRKAPLTPVERMVATKRRTIGRLRQECRDIEEQAHHQIDKIQRRIRIQQTILDALENGTLKP